MFTYNINPFQHEWKIFPSIKREVNFGAKNHTMKITSFAREMGKIHRENEDEGGKIEENKKKKKYELLRIKKYSLFQSQMKELE